MYGVVLVFSQRYLFSASFGFKQIMLIKVMKEWSVDPKISGSIDSSKSL